MYFTYSLHESLYPQGAGNTVTAGSISHLNTESVFLDQAL